MTQKLILAVEDDDIFAAFLEAVLADLGYATLGPVSKGEDAIASARANRPDLVLMDINLAGHLNGIETAEQIQSFLDVPIIYLTGHAEDPFLNQAKITTPYAYLVKPVTRRDLAATIEMALYRHSLDMKLRESDSRLKLALASSRMGVWEWNAANDEVFWSPECKEIFGSSDFDGAFESFTRLLHPKDASRVMAAIGQVSTDHPESSVEFRIIRPDGSVRWLASSGQGYFDATGALLRMTGIVRDITGRKATEEALKESEEKFRHVFAVENDALFLIDRETGAILDVNDTTCALYGYTREELLQMKGTDVSAEPEESDRTIKEQQNRIPARLHRKKDGTTFVADISASYFELKGRRVVLGAARDITERKDTEEALREAEERYRTLFTSMSEAFVLGEIICDEAGTPVDYRILEVNHAFELVTGSKADQVVGKTYKERSLDLQPAWLENYGRVATTGIPARFESYGRIGGKYFEVFSFSPVHGRFAALFTDISERKRVEEALRASRLQLAEAADMARIAYWEYDVPAGEFIFNDAFYELYGTTADREGGYRMSRREYGSKFIYAGDLEDLRRQVSEREAHSHADALAQYEHRGVRGDGEVIHVLTHTRAVTDAEGRTVKKVGVNQDITARKKMEEALRESETRFRTIFEGSRDAIGVSKDGIRTFVNPAYVSLFGFESAGELIGKPVIDLIAPESREFVVGMVKKSLLGESVPSFYEETALRKDGSRFLAEVTVSSYTLEGERFSLTILRDISDRRRLEEQLRQAQKMEAVGTLAGGVAHDFNNILTVIMGLGNLLQMTIGKDDIHRPHVDQIVASSERAADLTQSLLAFSRKQRITLEPHSVNGVVTSTAKLLRRLLPEDIDLSMNLSVEDTLSLLDVTQIGQVLMNLATNARDAMLNGGSLAITTTLAKIGDDFIKTHGFGCAGEYVKLSVSDTGTGMDDATAKRIFEPFFTTKEVGKGTGLGLASAYGIVKQHRGYITVSSVPFRGTTFDIYLPLASVRSPREAPGTAAAKGGKETILIVEDDRDVRNMLKRILVNYGYTTIEAVDGDDAIRVHREHGEHIDLIIIDVVMPGKNGKEALDAIIRTDPGVRAIFTSGYTGDIVIDKGVESENVDFLKKPIAVQTLLAKVREVLDR